MSIQATIRTQNAASAEIGRKTSAEAQVQYSDRIPAGWGVWDAAESYSPLQKVSHNGSSYVCMKANTGIDPETDVNSNDGVEGIYWLLIAKRGQDGEGKKGDKGEPFEYKDFTQEQLEALVITPEFSVGAVETLEPGSEATLEIGGTKTKPVLNMGLPAGRDGADGYGGAVVNGSKLTLTSAEEAGGKVEPATTEKLGGIIVGDNLTITEEGRLSVDTATEPEADNTRPITAAAVQASIGNIEVLLQTI